MVTVEAQPYAFTFDPESTALVCIDFQRDFVEPGGFGESLGNDVSLLRSTIEPTQAVLAAFRGRGGMVIHTREGHRPDLADLFPSKRDRGNPSLRIGDEGPDGPAARAGLARPRHHPRARSDQGRGRAGQARQGIVLRDRPGDDPAGPWHHAPRRHRRHHRGVRPEHRARGQRPGLRLPRPGRLHRLVLPRVLRGRPGHVQRAGRDCLLGRRLGRPAVGHGGGQRGRFPAACRTRRRPVAPLEGESA